MKNTSQPKDKIILNSQESEKLINTNAVPAPATPDEVVVDRNDVIDSSGEIIDESDIDNENNDQEK